MKDDYGFEKHMYTTFAEDHVYHGPLSREALEEAFKKAKASSYFYICENKRLPDDCLGMLIMRPDDAKQLKVAAEKRGFVLGGKEADA